VSNNTDSRQYISFGPSFIDVANEDGVFTLANALKVGDGYDWQNDKLYLVDPETCEPAMTLVNINGVWRDQDATYAEVGDEEFAIGTGFQAEFSDDFALTSSGQVHSEGYTVDCTGMQYQFIVNATGRDITWSELVVEGDYDWQNDKIYVIDPETCEPTLTAVNINGVWRNQDDGYAEIGDEIIPVGEGFQTEFSDDVQITFPPAIEE